jgi:nitrile hydratase alpha subunit
MNQPLNSTQAAYSKITARAWSDPAYKARLMADPAGVLKEAGIDMPAGMKLRAVENTNDTAHFILPAPPTDGELSEESLSKVAGGTVVTVCVVCVVPCFC